MRCRACSRQRGVHGRGCRSAHGEAVLGPRGPRRRVRRQRRHLRLVDWSGPSPAALEEPSSTPPVLDGIGPFGSSGRLRVPAAARRSCPAPAATAARRHRPTRPGRRRSSVTLGSTIASIRKSTPSTSFRASRRMSSLPPLAKLSRGPIPAIASTSTPSRTSATCAFWLSRIQAKRRRPLTSSSTSGHSRRTSVTVRRCRGCSAATCRRLPPRTEGGVIGLSAGRPAGHGRPARAGPVRRGLLGRRGAGGRLLSAASSAHWPGVASSGGRRRAAGAATVAQGWVQPAQGSATAQGWVQVRPRHPGRCSATAPRSCPAVARSGPAGHAPRGRRHRPPATAPERTSAPGAAAARSSRASRSGLGRSPRPLGSAHPSPAPQPGTTVAPLDRRRRRRVPRSERPARRRRSPGPGAGGAGPRRTASGS